MAWDDTNDIWTVNSMNFDDTSQSGTPMTIHSMNLSMTQILKMFQALDIPLQASAIKILPGPVIPE